MEKKAIAWIRDGVLVDRMAENAIMFALACYQQIPLDQKNEEQIRFEELINWCFKQSGVSTREKILRLNEANKKAIRYSKKKDYPIPDVDMAVEHYTYLSQDVEASLPFFPNMLELLKELKENDVHHFITSAVLQDILDTWAKTKQGQQITPYIEILGDGPKGQKGKSHFEYIKQYGFSEISLIADAVSEIRMAKELGIRSIAFAHVITRERLKEAFHRVITSNTLDLEIPASIDFEYIKLQSKLELRESLTNAGADIIIGPKGKQSLVECLREYFVEEGLLQ